jgi:hypothetical protein
MVQAGTAIDICTADKSIPQSRQCCTNVTMWWYQLEAAHVLLIMAFPADDQHTVRQCAAFETYSPETNHSHAIWSPCAADVEQLQPSS